MFFGLQEMRCGVKGVSPSIVRPGGTERAPMALSRLPRRSRVFLPPLAMQQRLVIMELWPANA